VSDLYCPGYNPGQTLAKDSNLARTVKALAFGAKAILIGRPYVYGLGAEGEAGVTKVLNVLQHAFQVAMALTGRTNVASIDRSVIWS
jgi:4-hydroxymandelate oxidase